MMDIKTPDYFVTLAEQKNMRKASELLFLSQPTLSYYLNKLEQDIGTPLFYRKKNELELTKAGELYLEAALKTIHIRDEVYLNISRLNSENHLYIISGSLWVNKMLATIVPQLYSAFPHIQLETAFETLHAEDIFHKPSTAKTKADFCIGCYSSAMTLGEGMEILRNEEMFFSLSASHPYCTAHPNKTNITAEEIIRDFQDETLVISREKSCNREVVQKMYYEAGNSFPKKICEVNGLALTSQMISSGFGFGFLPVSGLTISSDIRYFTIEPKLYRYNVMWHRANLEYTPAQNMFIQLVHDYIRKDKDWASQMSPAMFI